MSKTNHRYTLTPVSGNKKTGPIAVSMTDRSSCPTSCPFKGKACYAESWPLRLHWDRCAETGLELSGFVKGLLKLPFYALWRHDQAGDLPGEGDALCADSLAEILKAAARRKLRGFTYTHKPLGYMDNGPILQAVAESSENLTVNVSANSLAHYDELADTWPELDYAVALPLGASKVTFTPVGRRVVKCPAQAKGSSVTCSTCGNGTPLCFRKGRNYAIGFEVHGNNKRAADTIARG